MNFEIPYVTPPIVVIIPSCAFVYPSSPPIDFSGTLMYGAPKVFQPGESCSLGILWRCQGRGPELGEGIQAHAPGTNLPLAAAPLSILCQ